MFSGKFKNASNKTKEQGCNSPTCLKAFCRPYNTPEMGFQIIKTLSFYGKLFNCDFTEQLLSSNYEFTYEPTITNVYLDLFLYSIKLIYGHENNKKFTPRSFKMKKTKTLKLVDLNNKSKIRRNSVNIPMNDLEHSFCNSLNELNENDSYILTGILHLMLNKFQRSPNFLFGLIIIRLFIFLSKKSRICESYYSTLYNVFNFIWHKLSSALIQIDIPEHKKCNLDKDCLFQLNFTKNDMVGSLETVKQMINELSCDDFKENKKNTFLFEIFQLIYKINQQSCVVSYECFYLYEFYSNLNIALEYKELKLKKETPIIYKFTIPVQKKAELLKLENCDMQRGSLQDSFFRSLFEGITEPYLTLAIRREYIYEDALKILKNTSNRDLRKQLKISFINEDGVDSGGIIKEFFQLLSNAIKTDKELFIEKNSTLWLKPGADLNKMKIIGKIIGIALYNNVILNIPFNTLLFKKFINKPILFEDLNYIEPEIYISLCNMEKLSTTEFNNLGLTFEIEYEENETIKKELLLKNGHLIKVTKNNFYMFKELYASLYIDKMIFNEFTEVLDGFYSVIIGSSIEGFNYYELEKIVVGIDQLDIDKIKKTCIYQGYTSNATIVKWFWSIVEDYNLDMQKKLLKFITGNDRLPIGGPDALNLTIMKNGCDTNRLPSSQTCFNTILLPEYSSYDKLMEKMQKALDMTAGFYLM